MTISLLMSVALWVRLAIAPVSAGLQYLTFFPAVALSAIVGGYRAGLLATVVGAALATFIFTPPYYTFSTEVFHAGMWSNLVFLMDGCIVSFSIEVMHRYRLRYAVELELSIAANAALKDNALRFKQILDNLFTYVSWLDVDGTVREVNMAPLDRGGYRKEDVIGQRFYDAPWWTYDAAVRSQLIDACEAARQGQTIRYDVVVKMGDALIPIDFQISPVRDEDGRIVGLLPIGVEISERKLAEAASLKSETNLRLMIDNLPYLVWLKDTEGRYIAANKVLAKSHGLEDSSQTIGKTDLDLHPKELAEKYRADDAQVMASRQQKQVEELAFDGHALHWMETFKTPIIDAHGCVLGTAGFAQDITERKRVDAELRIAATAFESQDGMVVTDANNVILRVNRAFTEITGYTAEELVGQNPSMLKSERHNADFYREMWSSINRTGGWNGEIWDRRKDGEVYPKSLTISAVKGSEGAVTHYVGSTRDITERKKTEEKITELAFFDQLTGLPNRTLLLDRLKQAIAASSRSGSFGALLFIDLDDFKALNDTLGHDVGDLLLQQVAERLSLLVRDGDTVARLGGDEFVIILAGLGDSAAEAAAGVETVGDKLLSTFNRPYSLGNVAYHSTASIGVTLFGDDLAASDELMKQADLAMYKAKEAGRNLFRFFDPSLESAVKERTALEAELRLAIDEKQFLLHYQPQMTSEGRLMGAEALIRWHHPRRGTVPPDEFIPMAEKSELILSMGAWVLRTACRQLAAWANRPEMAHLTVSVNVSARQFRQPGFVDQVLAELEITGADPHRLKLELTESLLVDNVQDVIEKMVALKARGVDFSLDDFGTGYSSLSYLKRMPLYQLKIDRSFVGDVLSNPNDAAIAKTIIALAGSLGLNVIAEGVETEAQRDFLADSGCHAYQGYFFSRPLPIDGFEQFALGVCRPVAL